MKKQTSMKVFTVLRYVLLGGILGYLIAEAVIHGFFDRFSQIPSFHALCPFEAFGSFLNTLTGLEFFSNPFASASVFFIVLILLAILLNRVFCGFLCAFGALQEFVGNLGKKVLKKRFIIPKRIDNVLRALKYVFLVLSVLLAYFSGYEFFRNLIGLTQGSQAFSYIDPWIAFKNLLSNNLLVTGYISSLVVLVISLVGSFFFQRFYCKYVCPLGGLLAVFGSLSGLHAHKKPSPVEAVDETACTDCASCSYCNSSVNCDELEDVELTASSDSYEEIEAISDNTSDFEEYESEEEYYEYDEYYDEDPNAEENNQEENYCINCGKCSEVCPMGIDVASVNGSVDFAECINCQKCVAVCPQKGVMQTRYFKAKVHPILILLLSVVIFFGAAFALNFIKIDRGGAAKEPIYDSIRVNPVILDKFDVDEFLDVYKSDFSTVKDYLTFSEVADTVTIGYCKTNSSDYYAELTTLFGIDDTSDPNTSFRKLLDTAPIKISAVYLGFDKSKMTEFAEYFGATPDDSFGSISERFYELSDEFFGYNFNANETTTSLIKSYAYWHQCAYGAKYSEMKNFYELLTECEFENSLADYFAAAEYNVGAMLSVEGITLDELKKTYHVGGEITLSTTYAELQDAVMLSYYAEYDEANKDTEDYEPILPGILEIYGLSLDTVDTTITVGELLESGTVLQAAKFMGCQTDDDIKAFSEEYGVTDLNAPYSEYHAAVNASTDEYYNMLYQYYYSGY